MEYIAFEELNIEIVQETGRSFLVAELPTNREAVVYNYQLEMAANNPSAFMIPFEIRRKNDRTAIFYDISRKIRLADALRGKLLSKEEFVSLLREFADSLEESKRLLLYERNFLIKHEFIYMNAESGRLCLVYLPCSIKLDYMQGYKDFILGLITKNAQIRLEDGDNYMQRIIEAVKAPSFSIGSLTGLLREMKSAAPVDDRPKGKPGQPLPPPIDENFPLTEHFRKAGQEGKPAPGARADKTAVMRAKDILRDKKKVGAVVAGQVVIIGLALLMDVFMKSKGIDTEKRYILIALFVLLEDYIGFTCLIRTKKKPAAVEKHGETAAAAEMRPMEKAAAFAAEPAAAEGTNAHMDETVLLSTDTAACAFLCADKNGSPSRCEVGRKGFIIGRSPEVSDMVVDDKAVGRVQAEISFRGGSYYILDKNSKNGTYVNDLRLDGGVEYMLKNGDKIIFANQVYEFTVS